MTYLFISRANGPEVFYSVRCPTVTTTLILMTPLGMKTSHLGAVNHPVVDPESLLLRQREGQRGEMVWREEREWGRRRRLLLRAVPWQTRRRVQRRKGKEREGRKERCWLQKELVAGNIRPILVRVKRVEKLGKERMELHWLQ